MGDRLDCWNTSSATIETLQGTGFYTTDTNAGYEVRLYTDPTDPNDPGWFHLGPTPGQLGSSVLLGHVDSRTGPAVFFHLRQLSPGDEVIVVLADHLRERFTVRSVSTYDKARFPARRVYGATSHRSLNLVTCGGAFDSATGSYVANVVVTTRLTSTEPVIDGLGLSEPTRAGVASRRSGS